MNVQLSIHNCGRVIKSYSDLLINVSPSRNKMAFWHIICCFWVQEFSESIFFKHNFSIFRRNPAFLPCWWWKKAKTYFSLLKKGQGAAQSEKPKKWTLLNFVKGPFFSYWIIWSVCFSPIEFCEKSVFFMWNFVKCPKTEAVSP